MCDGYHVEDEGDHPDLEDEFLCEYVDGTMDPVVQKVFEEYVRQNPELYEHIECLRHTRLLLCRYGCQCHAPRDLHDQLRRRISCDLIHGGVPFHILAADRLKGVASVSCAVALVLLLGFMAGATPVETTDRYATMVSAAVVGPSGSSTFRSPRPEGVAHASFVQERPYTPRVDRGVSRFSTRSVVAAGIGHELRRGDHVAIAADLRSTLP